MVNNETDVGFVNAHAESDGRTNDALLRFHKFVLHRLSFFPVHAGMVSPRFQSTLSEKVSNFVRLPFQSDINDCRTSSGPQKRQDFGNLRFQAVGDLDFECEATEEVRDR